jgi:hypothetical protein
MSRISLGFCLPLCAALSFTIAASAQTPTPSSPAFQSAPVPPAILHARTVFVANGGADGGMFPHPFSGDTSRGYTQLYAALQERGQYQLVTDPTQADLVLELRLMAPYGPTSGNKINGAADPVPAFRLVIYDRKSHYVLWALTESIDIALKQKTHDRNFDEALSNLVADFEALGHPQTAAAH